MRGEPELWELRRRLGRLWAEPLASRVVAMQVAGMIDALDWVLQDPPDHALLANVKLWERNVDQERSRA